MLIISEILYPKNSFSIKKTNISARNQKVRKLQGGRFNKAYKNTNIGHY